MMETRYVCSKCGDVCEGNQDDWLIANVPNSTAGEMVIRCPQHITEYAIRKAGGQVRQGVGHVDNGWGVKFKYDVQEARHGRSES
jgi:DNA-directed RNA polymerase subunit RPC12/RpoP